MSIIAISRLSKRIKYAIVAAFLVVVIIIAVSLVIALRKEDKDSIFKGAIVTNGPECSIIAKNILLKGGTVADAAISALFCEGVTMPQSMSIGAGFLMTIYQKNTKKAISLNARETAPKAATENMFGDDPNLSLRGGLSVATPGELRGYWELYKSYGGGVPWKDLVQPTIYLCLNGIKVTEYIAYILQSNKEVILNDIYLSEIFINNKTNDVWLEGDIYYRLRLAKTLEIIAREGGETLHNGSLTEQFVKDIQNQGGIVTVQDMNDYRPKWQIPVNTTLIGDHTVFTQPLPGSGNVLTMILNILDNYLNVNDSESLDNYQKIIETFKFAFAKRTLLGDPDPKFGNMTKIISEMNSKQFAENIRSLINLNSTVNDSEYYGANSTVPDDHGTAHISILAPNGDAITVTSTINYIFGAGFVSPSTGIILNDQMDDFSSPNFPNTYNVPPSPSNFIRPNKQPLSSMSPSIIIDKNGDVEMVIGAAGGTKIITGIAQIIVRHLWYKMELKEASDAKRLHHQLWPMRVDLEPSFRNEDPHIAEELKKIGHNVSFVDGRGFAAATCISTIDGAGVGGVVGVWDKRRSGSVSYL